MEGWKGALVAFSGGVDSTLLLKVGLGRPGEDTSWRSSPTSETYPGKEIDRRPGRLPGASASGPRSSRPMSSRTPNSGAILRSDATIARRSSSARWPRSPAKEGISFVLDGSNHDDLRDFRPGAKAGQGARGAFPAPGSRSDQGRDPRARPGTSGSRPGTSRPWPASPPASPTHADRGEEPPAESARPRTSSGRLGFRQLRVRHHGTGRPDRDRTGGVLPRP